MSEVLCQEEYFSIATDKAGVKFIQTGDEVLIVPLTPDSQVILTIEPSAAFGEPSLILPGGEIEPDEPYAETANRELQEEIGYRAEQIDFLGELRPFVKYLAVSSYIYLARNFTSSHLTGDEDYEIQIRKVPLDSFETLIASAELQDARVIAALYMARSYLESQKLSKQ